MRIDDFQDLDLSEEELSELEQSLDLIGKTIQQEEDIPLPDSLRGEALLQLLDGVEQEAPVQEPEQEKRKPAGKLIFGVFPQKYLAAAAMLALAVMVGTAYNRLPRTAGIENSTESSAPESQQIRTEDSEVAPDAATDPLQRPGGYAAVLNEINQRYNREDKSVYDRQKQNPQAGEETAIVTEQPEQESVQREETAEAVDAASPKENDQNDRGSAPLKGGLMQAPSPYQSSAGSQENTGESDASDRVAAGQGELSADERIEPEDASEDLAAPQVYSAAPASALSVKSETGCTYTLVPDDQDQHRAVLKIRPDGVAAESVQVEITSKEPVVYSQMLYSDGSLVVVGNLLEYPESYLQMTRTVYEEVGLEEETGCDRRDNFAEMTLVSVYRVAEQAQTELSHSQDYYQAGWYRTASIAEDGTLYMVTDKNIYGAKGAAEYLTEVIPVVGTQAEMNYLDSSRIYLDRHSTELDSYAVISSLDLSQPAARMETVAYLGDRMPVVRIAADGVYLGCTATGEQGEYSRMLRFDGADLSVVTASEDLGGLLVPQSFVSLPDTGCAVLIERSASTGGGISECAALVLDRSLGTVASVPVAVSPDEILGVEVFGQTMLVHTVPKIYQIDFSVPISPEVSVQD